MGRKIPYQDKIDAMTSYLNGRDLVHAAKDHGMDYSALKRFLVKNNIPIRTPGGFTEDERMMWVKDYRAGKSTHQISKDYHISVKAVCDILRKMNIDRNNHYSNLGLKRDYWREIDSIDKAYFLGLMLTDGNVSKKGTSCTLQLKSSDSYILEVFCKYTGNNRILRSYTNPRGAQTTTFRVNSSQWVKDLASHCVVPAKTFICEMPVLEEDMMPHLLRGMIDGDGWISAKKPVIGFCSGSKACVERVRDYLTAALNVAVHPVKFRGAVWCVMWSSKKDFGTIGEYLYKDKSDCYLTRKFNNYVANVHGYPEESAELTECASVTRRD